MTGPAALVVAVTGLPGAGKSTLARPLAAALDATLLQQDAVTEALFDALGVRDHAWTRAVSRVALDTVLGLLDAGPRSVVDAWWPAGRGARLAPWLPCLVEVRCVVTPELAATRFAQRRRHPGHHDDPAAAASVAAMSGYAGLELPCPVVAVDTTLEVDLHEVAERVLAACAPGGPDGPSGASGASGASATQPAPATTASPTAVRR